MHSRYYSDFVILRRESEGQGIGRARCSRGDGRARCSRGEGSRAAQRPSRLGAKPRAEVDSCSRLRLTL